jgi:hypothetical protein
MKLPEEAVDRKGLRSAPFHPILLGAETMKAFDYICELPGGVRFLSRSTDAVMFVTCAEDRCRHIARSDIFNVLTGKIEEAVLHFPKTMTKVQMLESYALEIPLDSLVSSCVVTKPRNGDESPPDPTEKPEAYAK